MVDALTPPDSVAEYDTPGEDIRLMHGPSKSIMTSRRKVVMRMDDPQKRPLPSYQLLEMQWNLQRVGALSTAAEPRQDEHGNDDADAHHSPYDGSPFHLVRRSSRSSLLLSTRFAAFSAISSSIEPFAFEVSMGVACGVVFRTPFVTSSPAMSIATTLPDPNISRE